MNSSRLPGITQVLDNAVPLPDAYKRCPQCQMTSARLTFTPSGNVPPRQLLTSSHAAFLITWGYIAIYLRGQLEPRRAGRFSLRSRLSGNGRRRRASPRPRPDRCVLTNRSAPAAPLVDLQRYFSCGAESEGKIMSTRTRVSHPIYNLLPTEIEGFDSLAELALDMRWSWNHATDEVWRQLDPELHGVAEPLLRVLADPLFGVCHSLRGGD